jgi:hypothetical protein
MRLALRAGFLALDTALLIGAIMVVTAVLDVARGDQVAAYAVGAQWKPAHFVPMHGVLALPLLAWLLARTPCPSAPPAHGRPGRLRLRHPLPASGHRVRRPHQSPGGPLIADTATALAIAAIVAAAARTLACYANRPPRTTPPA